MRWVVALCTCNETVAWDPHAIETALRLDGPPALHHRLWRDEIHAFMDGLGAREPVDGVLVACCGPDRLFREAAGAAGVDPACVTAVNLREGCFRVHRDRAAANAKAARLLRAAMREAERPPRVPRLALNVGPTVLVATDTETGLGLARRLGEVARPAVLLDERSSAFDHEGLHPLPWTTTWGRLVRVEGTLGAFDVTVERTQPIDLATCVHCQRCVPVCHTAAISAGLRLRLELCDRCGDCLEACRDVGAIRIPRQATERVRTEQVVVVTAGGAPAVPTRTGHHVLRAPAPGDIDALAWRVAGLIGEFTRPEYVAYDPDTCAGGAAGRQACGRCVPACPYGAIARDAGDPLRVRVDQRACEGCGACAAVCPTGSLTFTDPPPASLGARLRALLAPVPGTPPAAPVITFHCPEKGAWMLAEAARLGHPYAASVLPVPVACLRHVSDADMLEAVALGAAGVALLGCASCPHGERPLLYERIALVRQMLEAFGVGGHRVQLIAGDGLDAIDALDRLAAEVGPPPVGGEPPPGEGAAGAVRQRLARAIRALIDATGREPGRIAVPAGAPFAFPDVRVAGCTVCRSCVNVCPTHAFRFREETQALELRQVDCVDCGLCAAACPESVITLRHETFLTRAALEHRVLVRDEALRCVTCGAPFGNRRAVEVIEGKLLGMAGLVETFAAGRRNLLRMCPNCRAVAAMQEIDRGWEP